MEASVTQPTATLPTTQYAPTPSSQPSVPSFVPASRASTPVESLAAPAEVEGEVFEQSEFSEGADTSAVTNTALRGTRYKDSFIPPKPIEAEGNAMGSFHQQASAAVAPAPQTPAAPAAPESKLQLNPPKMPTPKPQKAASPSLFERITGSVQQAVEGIREEVQPSRGVKQQRVAPSPALSGGPGQTVSQSEVSGPSQGSLNIDAPAKPKKADDELDIPAFLRRQAN